MPPFDTEKLSQEIENTPIEKPVLPEGQQFDQAMGAQVADDAAQPVLNAQQVNNLSQDLFEHRSHKSVEDAQAYWKTLGHTYNYDDQGKRELNEVANGLALSITHQLGLWDGEKLAAEVKQETVQELIGTIRGVLVPIFAPMSEQEEHEITQEAMQTFFGQVEEQALVRLNQFRENPDLARAFVAKTKIQRLKETGKIDPFAPSEIVDTPEEVIRSLESIAAQAREFSSRAEDPRVQRIWKYYLNRGLNSLKAATDPDSDAAQELGLLTSVFSDIKRIEATNVVEKHRLSERIIAGELAANVNRESVHRRMARTLDNVFTSLSDVFSTERAMKDVFRGALIKNRLSRLGMLGVTESEGLGMAALTANPLVASDLLTAAATVEAKRNAGIPITETPTPEEFEKLQKRQSETLPVAIQRLASLSTGPFQAFERRAVFEEPGTTGAAVASAADRTLGRFIQAFMIGLPLADKVTDVLNTADAEDRSSFMGGAAGMAVAATTADASRELEKLDEELVALKEEATGVLEAGPSVVMDLKTKFPAFLRSGLGVPATTEQQREAQKLLKTKSQVSAIQARQKQIRDAVLNPEGNLLTAAGLFASQDQAAEVFSTGAARVGFTPRIVRQQYERMVARAVDAKFFGFTEKEVADATRAAAGAMKRFASTPTLSNSLSLVGHLARNAAIVVGADFKDTVKLFRANPKDGANALLLFGATGVGLGVASVPVTRRLRGMVREWFAMRDARNTLRDATALDVEATEELLGHFSRLAEQTTNKSYRRSLNAIVANLKTLRDNHRSSPDDITRGSVDVPKVAQQSRAAIQFGKRLKKIDSQDIYTSMEILGADAQTIASLGEKGIRDFINRIPAALGFGKFKLPMFLAKKGKPLAARIVDAIDSGTNPGEWGELPLSLDAMALGGGRMRVAWNTTLHRLWPKATPVFLNKILPNLSGARFEGGLPKMLAQFYNEYKRAILSQRALVSERLTDIDDFFQTQINARLGRLRDEHVEAKIAPTPEDRAVAIQRREATKREIQALVGQRRDVDTPVWDQEIDLGKLDWVQDLNLEDVLFWSLRRHGEHKVFEQLRLVGEDFTAFRERLKKAVEGGEDAQGLRRSLKNNLINSYLRSPGMDDTIRIDAASGGALTPFQGQRLAQRRAAARRILENQKRIQEEIDELTTLAAAPDADPTIKRALRRAKQKKARDEKKLFLTGTDDAEMALRDDLGLIRIDGVKEIWENLRRAARVERIALSKMEDPRLFRKMAVRVQDLNSLPADMQRKELQDFIHYLHANTYFGDYRTATQARAITALTPKERELLDLALTHRERFGQFYTLDELRERLPSVFAMYPRTSDEAISRLLAESESFQKTLIDDWITSQGNGLRDVPSRDHLTKPIVPQRYLTYEHNEALKKQIGAPSVETLVSPIGVDLSFTMPQRHLEKFRAIVSVRGGGPVSRNFDTREAAETWVKERFGGVNKDRSEGEEFVEGTTSLGYKYQVLNPLDPEAARELGLLSASKGLTARLRDFLTATNNNYMLGMLDRPNWAFTQDQWKARLRTKEGRALAKDYREVPDKEIFGPLRGKVIHKHAWAGYQDFQSYSRVLDSAISAMQSQSESLSLLGNLVTKTPVLIGDVTEVTKGALVQNSIARNWRVPFANAIGDKFIFGTAASDLGFITTPTGWKASARALKDLWDFMVRGKTPDNPNFPVAAAHAVLDDFSMVGRIDGNTRNAMNELFFNTPDTVLPDKMRLYGKAIKDWEGDTAFDDFANAVGARPKLNNQEQGLAARWEVIDKRLKEDKNNLTPEQLDALEREKLSIEDAFERNGRAQWNHVGRAGVAVFRWITGAPSGILRDKDLFSSRLYSMINNLGRLGAFYYNLARGLSPEYAAWRVNTFMQTYSRVPRVIREQSRRNPIVSPVVSFPYEAIRIQGNLARYNWPAFMALMLGSSAWNFFAMAVGGIDPYVAYRDMAQHSPFGAMDLFTGTFLIPKFDGTFDPFRYDALNMPAFLRYHDDPALGNLLPVDDAAAVGWKDLPERAIAGIGRTLISTFGGGPLLKFGISSLRGVDPSNGRKLDSYREAVGRSLANLGRSLIPNETPFVGSTHHEIVRNLESPPYMRTDRVVTFSQRVLQQVWGPKLRGRLGTGEAANLFARTVAFLTGGTDGLPIVDREPQSINYEDFLVASLNASKRLTDRPMHDGTMYANDEFNDLRYAQNLRSEAERTGDKSLLEIAKKVERDAIQSRVKKRAARRELAEADPQRFVRSIRQDLERAKLSTDFKTGFQQSSIRQQTHIILEAASVNIVPKEVVRSLIALATHTPSGGLRSLTDTESLRDALDETESWLQNPWRSELTPLVSMYYNLLNDLFGRAQVRDVNSIKRDATRLEIIRQLREQGLIDLPTTPRR